MPLLETPRQSPDRLMENGVPEKMFKKENQAMLREVAQRMGVLCESVVFLGGAVLPFLLTEGFSDYVRYAKDVDFIIDFDDKEELFLFEDALWERGFKKVSNGAVCQWILGRIKIDALPADPDVLTFNNQWCAEAMQYAQRIEIGEGLSVNTISAAYYLGTKLNAFDRRGFGHFSKSKDVFDMLLIFAGHETLEQEVEGQTTLIFRAFLWEKLCKIQKESAGFSQIAARGFEHEPALQQALPKAVSCIKNIIALTAPADRTLLPASRGPVCGERSE